MHHFCIKFHHICSHLILHGFHVYDLLLFFFSSFLFFNQCTLLTRLLNDVIFDNELSIGFNNYSINVPKKILNNIVIPSEFNNMENYFDKLPLKKWFSVLMK